MSLPDLSHLPDILVEPILRAALIEDLGRAGDITSAAVIPAGARMAAVMAARQPGVMAGGTVAALAFRLLDPGVETRIIIPDGAAVVPGDVVMTIEGPARSVLGAERVALNLACRLAGIATATAGLVAAAAPHQARITCTRKTTPGLRLLEKYAVRAGGGANHRFGLDDAVLIKDNHIAVAGGAGIAIRRARAHVGHLVKIEVEIDRLDQLDEVLEAGADAILLDNMTPAELAEAVARIGGRAITEASGRITRETVGAVAASGVDLISAGWLTHSAPILDLGLDMP
ncbi:carboxylating nicotinate-nucleotide diphosphorylase [Tistrella mobilis]|uniref:Probable nicotinate-nucleotide pyrophosphorylase [carboxylating] n=2 Tax=Tistrella mobilis TaxID=171437 RepID=I3TLV4_TISMK|nr:carboxylating nicotinate-nucleotide diphosphorylase [Tistrella mobilis]AFK53742.1 nicotinate-nucleotide pyrophosphorylase [Tistrella mobilis KA081020-065]